MRKLFVTISPILIMLGFVFLIGGAHPQKTRYDYYYYTVFLHNGATMKVFSCDPVMNGVYVNDQGHMVHLSNNEVRGWEFVGKSKLPSVPN